MIAAAPGNFAGRLVEQLGPRSHFMDAATGAAIAPAELPASIAGTAAALARAGLKAGDPILIGCSLSPASSLVYLGAIYSGLVAVPVDSRTLSATGPALAAATGAKAVWTDPELRLGWLSGHSLLHLEGQLADKDSKIIPPADRSTSDLAALMATSGSTGVPRFVKVSHGNLIANTEAIARSQDLRDDERAILILPVSYCFGASVLHTHLFRGGGVVFDRRFMFPDKVLRAAADYACTTFAGVPTAYNVLLRRSNLLNIPLPSLRRFLQAGGRMAPAGVAEMRAAVPTAKFYVMYGQTEATARISCMPSDRWESKPGSVGPPLDNVTVRVLDESGREVPTGQIGEIVVSGPSICSGYLNDPEETRRVFTDCGLRTGDLGRVDAEGDLWIEGRIKALVKIRGIRVSLSEVEEKVAAIPGVGECAVSAADHPEAGQALVLFIVPSAGAKLAEAEVRRALPAHWAIDSVRMVSELPKTASGKISMAALAESRSDHGPGA
jgi:acyl-CoA synthetase (AMP-forming)/AMP-acid ligase II